MILACQNICKAYGIDDILVDVSFHIEEKEKMAIVGINGAGKSTLLKIIMGEETLDSGQVVISKDKTIGYLSQQQTEDFNNTIYNEMLLTKSHLIELENSIRDIESKMKEVQGEELNKMLDNYHNMTHEFEINDGYSYRSEIVGVIKGLGFGEEDFDREISTLSGGQKTRVALGRLLLSRPDLILLDEPTNHLDMESIRWLEGYLTSYKGSVIIVSHDRYFLDKTVTKIVELDQGRATTYNGNYTYFAEKRAEIRNNAMKAYENQQREIKHQEEVITKLKSFNREKSIKRAESREKMLDKIEVMDRPTEVNSRMKLTIEPAVESGEDVLYVEGLKKTYDNNTLFDNLGLDIKRGEKVAIIGNNGTGKTTILKIINKYVPKDEGKIVLGSRVKIGYYDQEHQVLSMNKNIFEEISDAYPGLNNTKIRSTLAAFLFTGDDVFKRIGDLSGGEKARVSLAKLMLSSANLLILDEPTNHLDIVSKEILENALRGYTGTLLFVSHDRYFINQVATRILDLVDCKLDEYKGNYDYYLDKKDIVRGLKIVDDNSGQVVSMEAASENKMDWKKNKEEQARLRKIKNDIAKIEKDIEKLEAEGASIDEELVNPEIASNHTRLTELSNRRADIDTEIEQLMEQWEELSD